jgi:hypothetical protein
MPIDSSACLARELNRLECALRKSKKIHIRDVASSIDHMRIHPGVCNGSQIADHASRTQMMPLLASTLAGKSTFLVTSLCGFVQKCCSNDVVETPAGLFGALCLKNSQELQPCDSIAAVNASAFVKAGGIDALIDLLWKAEPGLKPMMLRTLLYLSWFEVCLKRLAELNVMLRLLKLCQNNEGKDDSHRFTQNFTHVDWDSKWNGSPIGLSFAILANLGRVPSLVRKMREQGITAWLAGYCDSGKGSANVHVQLAARTWLSINGQSPEDPNGKYTTYLQYDADTKAEYHKVAGLLLKDSGDSELAPLMSPTEVAEEWHPAQLLKDLQAEEWSLIEDALPRYGEMMRQLRYESTKPHRAKQHLEAPAVQEVVVQSIRVFTDWPKQRAKIVKLSYCNAETEFVGQLGIMLNRGRKLGELIDVSAFLDADGLVALCKVGNECAYRGMAFSVLNTLMTIFFHLFGDVEESKLSAASERLSLFFITDMQPFLQRSVKYGGIEGEMAGYLLNVAWEGGLPGSHHHAKDGSQISQKAVEQLQQNRMAHQSSIAEAALQRLSIALDMYSSATTCRESAMRLVELEYACDVMRTLAEDGDVIAATKDKMDVAMRDAQSILEAPNAGEASKSSQHHRATGDSAKYSGRSPQKKSEYHGLFCQGVGRYSRASWRGDTNH